MITAEFEEALLAQIASMTELEKESFFEKLHPILSKDNHDHTVSSVDIRYLEKEIDGLNEDLETAERERDEAREQVDNIKSDLKDALKLPLSELHNKMQEIINDL